MTRGFIASPPPLSPSFLLWSCYIFSCLHGGHWASARGVGTLTIVSLLFIIPWMHDGAGSAGLGSYRMVLWVHSNREAEHAAVSCYYRRVMLRNSGIVGIPFFSLFLYFLLVVPGWHHSFLPNEQTNGTAAWITTARSIRTWA